MRRPEGAHLRGPLAQLEEQLTLNQPVLGSSPRRLTISPSGTDEKPGPLDRVAVH